MSFLRWAAPLYFFGLPPAVYYGHVHEYLDGFFMSVGAILWFTAGMALPILISSANHGRRPNQGEPR